MMMAQYQSLFNTLSHTPALVLCATQRLAASLHFAFAEYQGQSNPIWPTASILALNTWLEQTWKECHEVGLLPPKLLLTPHQTLHLWLDIIAKSTHAHELIQLNETAEQAQSAWRLIADWQIPLSTIEADNIDCSAFLTWANAYQQLLTQHHWQDPHCLIAELLTIPKTKTWVKQNTIYLCGFDQLSPALENVILYWRSLGKTVTELKSSLTSTQCQSLAFVDKQQEMRSMVAWALSQLARDPHQSLACIVPNLEDERDDLLQLFREQLWSLPPSTNSLTIDLDDSALMPVNISAGKNLASYPLCKIALTLLNLPDSALTLTSLREILLSPYLKGARSEAFTRANLDARLRELELNELPYQKIIDYAKQEITNDDHVFSYSPEFADCLERYQHFRRSTPVPSQPLDFIVYWRTILTLWGWPGLRELNSHESQTVEKFYEVLNEFSQLAGLQNSFTLERAQEKLCLMLKKTVFQPKSHPNQIQVLGLLEASGLYFDQCWVMGMDDKQWPSPPQPNPFLPLPLQRQCHMPQSSSEREFHFAQHITQRIQHSAPTVYISYHQHADDEHLQLSPLFLHCEIGNPEFFLAPLSFAEIQFSQQTIETLTDEQAPLMQATELASIRGGAGLLKSQAVCPFQAFARYRLRATALKNPSIGLDALTRGSILHRALELIWQKLSTQQQLLELSPQQLRPLIQDAVQNALRVKANFLPTHSELYQLECERVTQLLIAWCEIEKTHEAFVVKEVEAARTMTINSLSLNLKVDRIDQLADGSTLIIDYKTGKTSFAGWCDARLSEPQLPLYCLMENAQGIAFAQIRSQEMALKGICRSANSTPGIKIPAEIKHEHGVWSWDALLHHWQTTLHHLAEEFLQGIARVDPVDGEKTCRLCDLQPFCRITEHAK
ncbi:MAG: PD-(D/E)XK nuclease family protein [Legionellales bacterium]|nr:PD-(D/E)XK nuclease family protein [Legionellales bacterium]